LEIPGRAHAFEPRQLLPPFHRIPFAAPASSANGFSHWLANSIQAPELARRANRIDIYANTLDGARDELIELVDGEINQ
jgi:hypothetical protein